MSLITSNKANQKFQVHPSALNAIRWLTIAYIYCLSSNRRNHYIVMFHVPDKYLHEELGAVSWLGTVKNKLVSLSILLFMKGCLPFVFEQQVSF